MIRKTLNGILFLQIVWICACSTTNQHLYSDAILVENQTEEELKLLVGKKIVVTGKTVNMKLGAALHLKNERFIWMDELFSWPDGFYISEKKSKTVKVTGVLTERNDLPVFIHNENDSLVQQGIPVPKGTDLKKASHRFLLKEYKWVQMN